MATSRFQFGIFPTIARPRRPHQAKVLGHLFFDGIEDHLDRLNGRFASCCDEVAVL
jgi:hypothetical protein